jgi:hypothetical protein
MRREVQDNYLYGNFRAVIDQCLDLQKDFGPESLTPDMGLLLALSLAEEGMLEEAVSIGQEILRGNEASPDLFYLRVKVAQWQLDLGRRARAVRTYNRLTDRMDDQEHLLGGLKQAIVDASRDPLAVAESLSGKDEDSQKDHSIEAVLREVDTLVQDGEFDKAKILLIRHRISTRDEHALEALDLAMKRVERAEDEMLLEPKGETAPEAEEIRLARQLIEEQRFEEAIARLETLGTGRAGAQDVASLKEEAVEKLIQRERNRAARLFLAAKEAQDPSQKRDYLQSSRDILKRLLMEYPSSNLYNKIKSNLEIVETELDRVSVGNGNPVDRDR